MNPFAFFRLAAFQGLGSITYSESGTLPAGLTYVAGTLSGTPTQTGSFPISIKGTDANGCFGMSSYNIVINCPTINVGPASIPVGVAGIPYSTAHFTETGGVGTITYGTSGTLPTGMTFTAAGFCRAHLSRRAASL
ncbi:MAG: putative Ig domain-containing protein [Blastocatellia bacterium]